MVLLGSLNASELGDVMNTPNRFVIHVAFFVESDRIKGDD
jgi:hypothetical protein